MKRLSIVLTILMTCGVVFADEKKDAVAIRKRVESYVKVYNKGDAKALAEFWSDKAVYVNRASGEKIQGREAIQKMFEEQFADDVREHLGVSVTSIRFITSEVAVEEGVARIVSPDEPPSESTYTAIHVKQKNQWYLDSVRESTLPAAPSHHNQLAQLSWMIGEWVDQDENATVRTKCQWTKNHNFITRSFSISIKDRIDLEGTQVVGWDPAAGRIRSWMFDTNGGFAESIWSRDGNSWTIKAAAVLSDGRRGASVRILTYIDDNTLTLQTVAREVDGEILPNIEEFKVVRVQPTE